MARFPRLNIPFVPQHIVQRGNNRQACFYTDKDFTFYLSKLTEAAQTFEVKIHAFILMTNHVHLLATPSTNDGVSRMMQCLGRNYVRYINITYQRTGTLWEGRFKSSLVDSSGYFLTVQRYIELNPVRANLVVHPSEYQWSSFHHNVGEKRLDFVSPHREYLALGIDEKTRVKHYIELVEMGLPMESVTAIRDSFNKSKVLGSSKFKKEIETMLQRRVEPVEHGGDRRSDKFQEL